jgi:hypothetical protein
MHLENFEFLREFEFICEKALVPLSGDQDGCFGEKTEVENLVTLSL